MFAYVQRTYQNEMALIQHLKAKGRTHQVIAVTRRLKGFHDYLTGLGYKIDIRTGIITP